MNGIDKFVEFLHAKFRTDRGPGPSNWCDGHDVDFSDSLLYHGSADTEGGYSTGIDYTELLRKIDEFAAEFKSSEVPPRS